MNPQQSFSTWGLKLSCHARRLMEMQELGKCRPITVQLAPTDACDMKCRFCSVKNRPMGAMRFSDVEGVISAFNELGAMSLEITGGGNPLMYRDGEKTINDIVMSRSARGLAVGVITNSPKPRENLSPGSAERLRWIRISLAGLDQGLSWSDYDFDGFTDILGFSYILNEGTEESTFEQMSRLVERWPSARFVRIATDCASDNPLELERRWQPFIDKTKGMFLKETAEYNVPYQCGCWVGCLRPYVTPQGVYICTSHVLRTGRCENPWRLCGHTDILACWRDMETRMRSGKSPYHIDISRCWRCYYANNNALLDAVIHRMPDWEFA